MYPKLKRSRGQIRPSDSSMLCPMAAKPQWPTCHSDFVRVWLAETQPPILPAGPGDELKPAAHSLGVVLTLRYENKWTKIRFLSWDEQRTELSEAAALRAVSFPRGAALWTKQLESGSQGGWGAPCVFQPCESQVTAERMFCPLVCDKHSRLSTPALLHHWSVDRREQEGKAVAQQQLELGKQHWWHKYPPQERKTAQLKAAAPGSLHLKWGKTSLLRKTAPTAQQAPKKICISHLVPRLSSAGGKLLVTDLWAVSCVTHPLIFQFWKGRVGAVPSTPHFHRE